MTSSLSLRYYLSRLFFYLPICIQSNNAMWFLKSTVCLIYHFTSGLEIYIFTTCITFQSWIYYISAICSILESERKQPQTFLWECVSVSPLSCKVMTLLHTHAVSLSGHSNSHFCQKSMRAPVSLHLCCDWYCKTETFPPRWYVKNLLQFSVPSNCWCWASFQMCAGELEFDLRLLQRSRA